MAMTVLVTRDVAPRFRGFLASCMLEIAPGVYTAPRMSKAVRDRVWSVVSVWHEESAGSGSLVLTWPDNSQLGGQAILSLGLPPVTVADIEGIYLAVRPTTQSPK